MRRAFAAFALALVLSACPKPVPAPVTPDGSDAAVACVGGDLVCAYCRHMRELGCPEARNTPAGATCETVTANVQRSGIIAMDLACRTEAGTCKKADECR